MGLPDFLSYEWTADFLMPFLKSQWFGWFTIISLFYLIEKFDLGVHSFTWIKQLFGRHQCDSNAAVCNGKVSHATNETHHYSNGAHSSSDCVKLKVGNGHIGNGLIRNRKIYNGHVIQNGHVPVVLNRFIRQAVIPTFQPHTKGAGPHFSVLVLSNISSVDEVKHVNFRQVTFNGRPLVDPKLPVYPQSYRYENYIVAKPSKGSHAETLIVKDLRTLVKAYGVKERCYCRSPVPKFGLMYCWAMPCSECIDLVVKHLSSICSQRFILVYSHENSEQLHTAQESQRRLKNAGILVAKIAPD